MLTTTTDHVGCPKCSGTGLLSIVAHEGGSVRTLELRCIYCDGSGRMSVAEVLRLERAEEMWCSCGNPSGRHSYHADGQGPEISKHHYRCGDCLKVLQIG